MNITTTEEAATFALQLENEKAQQINELIEELRGGITELSEFYHPRALEYLQLKGRETKSYQGQEFQAHSIRWWAEDDIDSGYFNDLNFKQFRYSYYDSYDNCWERMSDMIDIKNLTDEALDQLRIDAKAKRETEEAFKIEQQIQAEKIELEKYLQLKAKYEGTGVETT